MRLSNVPLPHFTTAKLGPLHHLEATIINHVAVIEAWFRQHWSTVDVPITSSVDLRHAGFKLAPVDTNLFPAGFNNLNPDAMPLCVQAIQSIVMGMHRDCKKILIIPESHTRNRYYFESLFVIQDILIKAGFIVKIGSLSTDLTGPTDVFLESGRSLCIEPLQREGNRLGLVDFNPCVVLLNNDLSTGIPALLQGIEQPIYPSMHLGWGTRLKSTHFRHYETLSSEFASLIGLDPWLITPLFTSVEGLNFIAQAGLDTLAQAVDGLLFQIKEKYVAYDIKERPYVAVKADNGTYGMGVMMIQDAEQVLQLNRKQRTRMAASKGGQTVERVIVQEGVYSFETMADGAVAEPVIYMMGAHVVGGFYRVHSARGTDENLNAPGMYFEPLPFMEACNIPEQTANIEEPTNRFYVYSVIARLAALAAGYEAIA